MINHYRVTGILISVLISTTVTAASFDCKKAATAVEKAICANKELNKLDSEMAKGYQSLLKALQHKKEAEILTEEQREWLENRDQAFHNCDRDKPEDCLVYEYAVRVSTLGPLKHASFNCNKAGTVVEKKICASPLLSHADGQISALYHPRQKEFKDSQQEWLKERDKQLANSECDLRCAWDFYQERIRFFVHQNF